jgi:hypothetical protein
MPGEFDMDAGLASMSEGLFEGSGDALDGDTPAGDDNDDLGLGSEGEQGGAPDEGAAPAEKPAATPSASPALGPDGKPVVAPTPAPGPDALPKTWKQDPEILAKWATTDPAIKAEIQRREEAMFQGIEGYKADAADGKVFQQVFKPYENILKHYGVNPVSLTQGLLKAHHDLSLGTADQKVALFRQLAADYGVDVAQVAAEAPYEAPEVKALRLENQRLQSLHQQNSQQVVRATEATLNAQLDAFEADPKNVHFKTVGHDMVPFIKAGDSLEVAYHKALWVNPTTRAIEQARQTAEATAKAAKDEADRVAKAKAATGANVKASAKSGSATAPLGSMDDTMRDTLREIKARG